MKCRGEEKVETGSKKDHSENWEEGMLDQIEKSSYNRKLNCLVFMNLEKNLLEIKGTILDSMYAKLDPNLSMWIKENTIHNEYENCIRYVRYL